MNEPLSCRFRPSTRVALFSLIVLACGARNVDTGPGTASDGGADASAGDDASSRTDESIGEDECVRAFLDSDGACDVALPDAPWIGRLDCRAVIRLGMVPLECGSGWTVVDGERLQLEGAACDLVRARPDTPLEVRVPCTGVPEP